MAMPFELGHLTVREGEYAHCECGAQWLVENGVYKPCNDAANGLHWKEMIVRKTGVA